MNVSEIMNRQLVSVEPEEPVSLAARLLFRHNIGSLPVCTPDGTVKGIVTDRDIALRCVAADYDPTVTPVREIMTRTVLSASPQDKVEDAAKLMSMGQIRRLPVVENEKLVGFLSLADLARQRTCCTEAARALSDISRGTRKTR